MKFKQLAAECVDIDVLNLICSFQRNCDVASWESETKIF